MKTKFILLAAFTFVMSPVALAQEMLVISSPTENFGRVKYFSWSQESNLSQMLPPSLADKVQNETKRQLERVGFYYVLGDDILSGRLITVELNFLTLRNASGKLSIELYDARTNALLWRGTTQDMSNASDERLVRAVAGMFKQFPYNVSHRTFPSYVVLGK